jgi:hypothetical protein
MTKEKDLTFELAQAEEDIKSLRETITINREYTDGLQEEKAWHNQQYCLMRDERDALEKQIELEHELIEVRVTLSKAKEKRKQIDLEYHNEIEPKRTKKYA